MNLHDDSFKHFVIASERWINQLKFSSSSSFLRSVFGLWIKVDLFLFQVFKMASFCARCWIK